MKCILSIKDICAHKKKAFKQYISYLIDQNVQENGIIEPKCHQTLWTV